MACSISSARMARGSCRHLARALIEYDTALLKNDQAKEAEPVLRECLSIREKARKKNDQRIAEARGVLGECLTGQGADPSLALGARTDESARIGKLREAEALLIESAKNLAGRLPSDRVTQDRGHPARVGHQRRHRVADLLEAIVHRSTEADLIRIIVHMRVGVLPKMSRDRPRGGIRLHLPPLVRELRGVIWWRT